MVIPDPYSYLYPGFVSSAPDNTHFIINNGKINMVGPARELEGLDYHGLSAGK